MKKLILIFTILFSFGKLGMAQQIKTVPAKIDTTGPDKIPRGASIEELLKKLPGIDVDKNGKVITDGKPVNVNGKTLNQPTNGFYCDIIEKINEDRSYGAITYKFDTIQYRLNLYKPLPRAKLDQLLKILGGFETEPDGSLLHQRTPIFLFKVNNQSAPVSSLSKVIKIIPADAVEMVEVIDDYGRVAALMSIKTPEPDKLLNITLKKGKKINIKKLLKKK